MSRIRLEGFFCEYVSSAVEAVNAFKLNYFEYVLADFYLQDISGLELMFWLAKNFPLSKVIILSSLDSRDIKQIAQQSGAFSFLAKPVSIHHLKEIIFDSNHSFSGEINNVCLVDLIQIMQLDPFQKKVIHIKGNTPKIDLKVFIDRGKLVHAELIDKQGFFEGEQAFYKALRLKKGIFEQTVWVEPREQTINVPFQVLSMNAAQYIDESIFQDNLDKCLSLHNILVVDNEVVQNVLISKILRNQGYTVFSSKSDIETIGLLGQQKFDLIISSDRSPGVSLTCLFRNNITCPIIIVSKNSNDEMDIPDGLNIIKIFTESFELKNLIEFINLTSDNGFQGLLQDISLLDFIQMSLGAGERKCLDIRDIKEQVLCWLFIKEGRFIHAEYGELQGEQAFGKIISIQRGVFFERPWKVPASFSLEDHSPQKLLMKASREKFLSGSSVEVSDELYNTIEEKLKRLS